MARIRAAAMVVLAIGVLAALFFMIYEAGDADPGSRPPVVDVR